MAFCSTCFYGWFSISIGTNEHIKFIGKGASLMSQQFIRSLLPPAAAVATGVVFAVLVDWLSGGVFVQALVAAGGAVTVLTLMRKASQSGDGMLAAKIGPEIDSIMIGSAETSYFVDSIKKKIDQDVQTANEIAASAEQNAAATEHIAANAERASKVAADVRRESVAGRAEVDQGLRQINDARQDAQAGRAGG